MRTLQSLVTRREKNCERKARWRARKAELRIKRTKDEPIRGEWRGKFAFTLTLHNRITDGLHSLDFYLSQKRANSYRVDINGKPWQAQISASRALAALRKKLPRFKLHE